MKLMIVIIRDTDDQNIIPELIRQDYRVTRMASTGGFLRRGNVTLLIGVEAEKVDAVIGLLRQTCCPPEPDHHQATIFVVDMPYFEQF
ncbi:MAG: cyclic-di-AMP receptor [Anaerolineae bacterium]|nr:cyclic-di-AMP receptor [Anaerolineae bacterium]